MIRSKMFPSIHPHLLKPIEPKNSLGLVIITSKMSMFQRTKEIFVMGNYHNFNVIILCDSYRVINNSSHFIDASENQ